MMRKPRFLSLSIRAYRLLLWLYPGEHRRTYGPLMLQLFSDLCEDAYRHSGRWGLVLLWIRTLLDALATIAVEHWAAIREGSVMGTGLRVSWLEIALAALLGVYTTGLTLLIGPTASHWPAVVGLSLWAALVVIGLTRRVPIWSLPALGMLLLLPAVPLVLMGAWLWIAYPVAAAILLHRRIRLPWTAWALPILMFALGCVDLALGWTEYGRVRLSGHALASPMVALVPVLVGLALARRHGSRAALSVIAAETVAYTFMGEPTYAMISYPRGWIVSLSLGLPLLACPVWMLCARSPRWQKRAILWPWAGMLTICVVTPGLLRAKAYSWALWLRHASVAGEFFLAVLLAVSLYEWIHSAIRTGAAAESSATPVEGSPSLAGSP